jgi:peptide/nickel transport system ATP-binding protein
MAELLEVRDLEVKYYTRAGILTALREVNFSVRQGEIVGVVGESGCGKSTIAGAVMQLLPLNGRNSRGQVLFKGQDLCKASSEELRRLRGRDISMVFQDAMTSLNPVFDIETQMLDILRAQNPGKSKGELRHTALAMLDRVGIPDAAQRIKDFPHQFSGGMRQRIMIAMALMANPALLIADEPTSALDVTLEAQILELIRGLRAELGTAILYISHDLGVIAQLCDRVIVMYAGNIVERGDALAVFERPQHPYTRALLAAHPSHKRRLNRLLAIPGRVPSLKDLPLGCKFADRCTYRRQLCSESEPGYITIDEGHVVLCHRLTFGDVANAPAIVSISASAAPGAVAPAAAEAFQTDGSVLVATQSLHTHFKDRLSLPEQLIGRHPGYLRAVNGIDLNIRRGETVGLVGESGSGKTTLGKTILRLIKSSGGRILFEGQDITTLNEKEVRPMRARMQMIFQDPVSSLSPRMKVADLLMEPFRIQGVSANPNEKVPQLLEMVGLAAEQADKYAHELSGGQARRVGIARALALNPEFMVADEPTSGLDVSVAASLLNLLKDLREQLGLTYLIITHNLNVIGFIANRVGVMYLGRLLELGPTDEIFEHPAHPYTEALLMAISDPDPHQRELRKQRVLVKGEIPSPRNPPAGCPFHPRCLYADARCSKEQPELQVRSTEHLSACFYPERIKMK